MRTAANQKPALRFCQAPLSKKVKKGGITVVSEALVKKGSSNLIPKIHVKRGDMVMLMSGSKKVGKGQTGKVLNVFPKKGKIIVEGINIIKRSTKQKTPMTQSGIIEKEAPIFSSRVMLFCTACKAPTRVQHKTLETGKKARACKKCGEAFDG